MATLMVENFDAKGSVYELAKFIQSWEQARP